MPSPGGSTARFGGHTSCIEVRPDRGGCLIFDAGTGIAPLGQQLALQNDTRDVDLFLTHFHWDHIQGLPFFAPLYDAAWTIRIHAEPQHGRDIEEIVTTQMRDPFFPVDLPQVSAHVEYHHLRGRAWSSGDIDVAPFRVRHPSHTSAFRIAGDGAALVYMPDDEPEGRGYPVSASWESDVIEFIRGADVLLHDAMFTTDEYATRQGWGHGTFEQAVRLARAAAVPRLLLFHHAPHRSDTELDSHVARLQREAADGPLRIDAAADGMELILPDVHVGA